MSHQSHIGRPYIHTLVFFLLHLYTRSSTPRSRMHAGGRKPRFRPINKSRPPRSTGLPCFPHNNEKKKKKKERRCYSILQLLDFLIPGNNRENISPPPCSSFVSLPRRTPRRLATVYQLAVSRFLFYTFFFPPFETTLLAAYIIIPSSTVLFIILSLIETASLAGVVFGYGQGVS